MNNILEILVFHISLGVLLLGNDEGLNVKKMKQ